MSKTPQTEEEWNNLEEQKQAEAYRKLRMVYRSGKASGFTSFEHFADYIRKLDKAIYDEIGDCPE